MQHRHAEAAAPEPSRRVVVPLAALRDADLDLVLVDEDPAELEPGAPQQPGELPVDADELVDPRLDIHAVLFPVGGAASHLTGRFENEDLLLLLDELEGRRQAREPGANDDRVVSLGIGTTCGDLVQEPDQEPQAAGPPVRTSGELDRGRFLQSMSGRSGTSPGAYVPGAAKYEGQRFLRAAEARRVRAGAASA